MTMKQCKDYGLKCLQCPYWNHWTNFCTKWKITTSTSGDGMIENKRFKLDDFDSDVEMWELLNIQAEIISDLEDENERLREENKELEKFRYSVFQKMNELIL